MRIFGFLMILLVCLSCGAIKVDYDYDKATDFTDYTTYNYYPEMETGLSQLDEKRLVRLLDSTMQTKGMLLAEEPDILVNILSEVYKNAPQNTVGVGVGGTGRNVGGGLSIGIPVGGAKMSRNIQIDFIDAHKDALFWQAVSESGFKPNATPLAKEEQFRKVIAKIFAKYPPQEK